MSREAARSWLNLLTEPVARETHDLLIERQRHRGLGFGDRPLCTSLRPRFLSLDQYRLIQTRSAELASAFGKIHEAALGSAEFRRQFGLTAEEELLFQAEPGFRCPCPTARLDAFFTEPDVLRFTEFNAETPAAPAYTQRLSELFLELPIMREFQRRFDVRPFLTTMTGVLHALLSSWREFAGRDRAAPNIAIVDWRGVPTVSEFHLFRDWFRSLGLACQIVAPEDLEIRGNALFAGDFRIDLIYKRVLINELIERGGIEHPIVKAVRSGMVCMVNPFRCKPIYKKAALAVLTDERNGSLFNPVERGAIRLSIPWTRIVEERRTVFDGNEIDLIPWTLANRHRLVLKPNDDYGGRGIVLGWLTDDAAWRTAVERALKEPYIVQDRIDIPLEPWPFFSDGKLTVRDLQLDTAPFLWNLEYVDGMLTRISGDPLLNVTAGGGSTVPTFVTTPR
jgi:hypothetical protein